MKIKFLTLFTIVLTLIGCSNSNQNSEAVIDTTAIVDSEISENKAIDINETINKIAERVSYNGQVGGNLNEFKLFLHESDEGDIYSISIAEDLVKKYILAAKQPYIDSSYLYFKTMIGKLVSRESDSLQSRYPTFVEKLYKDINDVETQTMKTYFKLFGIEILSTEGFYYLEIKPDYFQEIYRGLASPALTTFLDYERKEKEEGFSADAGLLIEFEALYERILKWEAYIKNYPQSVVVEDAFNNYQLYLNTILVGMENSRLFSYETETLLPEIKTIYEKAMTNHPDLKSTEAIKAYYEFLKANDFKVSNKIYDFMSTQKLADLLGTQPPTQ